jgi:hypothetical protein
MFQKILLKAREMMENMSWRAMEMMKRRLQYRRRKDREMYVLR